MRSAYRRDPLGIIKMVHALYSLSASSDSVLRYPRVSSAGINPCSISSARLVEVEFLGSGAGTNSAGKRGIRNMKSFSRSMLRSKGCFTTREVSQVWETGEGMFKR